MPRLDFSEPVFGGGRWSKALGLGRDVERMKWSGEALNIKEGDGWLYKVIATYVYIYRSAIVYVHIHKI